MTTIVKSAPLALAALMALFVVPGTAQAQDQRLRASFAPAVATVSDDAEVALGGSFGYRFSERFWFEGELTWIDAGTAGFRDRFLQFDPRAANTMGVADIVRNRTGLVGGRIRNSPTLPSLPGLPGLPTIPIEIGQLRATMDGSTMIGTMGVRYELPTQVERFRPYVAGGLGINNTDQRLRLEATRFTPAFDQSTSHTGYAFSAGGGASVRLFSQLWADVDAKYFRLSRDRNIMRLGGGASFRF